jgi:shikimate dehydrogenase
MTLSGKAIVAGVAGAPVAHSLSPLIHNAWIEAAGLDAVYAPFSPPRESFTAFAKSLAGGAIRGLNVTVPFKEEALALATSASDVARRAGAANLLLFEPDGSIRADNTDGAGLLAALAEQAPAWRPASGPVVVFGAGGAARGAAAALIDAGASEVRLVNRTAARAEALAADLGARCRAVADAFAAIDGAALVVNATTLGLEGGPGPVGRFPGARSTTVVMDMVYRPLRTQFLQAAAGAGLVTVDGLAMLIGQAAPSFEAFYGRPPPAIDVRGLCLAALGETR